MIRNRNLVVDVPPPSLLIGRSTFISLSGRVPSNRLKTRPGRIIHEPGTRLEKGEVIWKWKSRNIINIFGASVFPFQFDGTMTRSHRIFGFIRRESFITPVSISLTYRVSDFNYIPISISKPYKSFFVKEEFSINLLELEY